MAWSCEKFKMEESEEGTSSSSTFTNGSYGSSNTHYYGGASTQFASTKRPFTLAVCFSTGVILLMKSYDDVAPISIPTDMHVSTN